MTERLEPFRQALVDLRRRLRNGELGPGARVTAKEVADGLKLSPTPVREALSRLAGEGVLEERRGDGFFVPELSAADIAVLYRISEQFLLMSQGESRVQAREGPRIEGATDDPIRSVELLFQRWVTDASSRVVIEAYRTAAVRLAPVRRHEVAVIDDLAQEAEGLLALAEPAARRARPAAIQAFYKRRVALAERLSDFLVQPTRDPD